MQSYSNGTRFRTRHAFTLIELLTVIAIIGILAAIIIPTVGKVRNTAKKAQCIARMRQWGNAIALAANDAKSRVPLGYTKLDNPTGKLDYVLDYYLNSGGATAESERSDNPQFFKYPTKSFSVCPTGINGGATASGFQYGFVIPIGTISKTLTFLGGTFQYSYLTSDAATPSKLLLMIEVKNASDKTMLLTRTTGDIKPALETASSVRSVQISNGFVRHGGSVNALFLDGHVAGLGLNDTDYTVSRDKLDQMFSLR